MPNWVYSTVEMEVPNSNIKLLEAIKERGGICNTYKPMPSALKNTRSPVRIVSKKEYLEEQKFNQEYIKSIPEGKEHDGHRLKKGLTQEMYDELIESYGHADWYNWARNHWGTKWGDCEFDYDIISALGDKISYVHIHWESAWGPVKRELVEEFINDVTSFYGQSVYWWEEEQGFGEEYHVIDDQLEMTSEWDLPDWGDDYTDGKGNYFAYLNEDYHRQGEVYKECIYLEYSLHQPYDKELHGEIKKVE
jgi:hypothetical protein